MAAVTVHWPLIDAVWPLWYADALWPLWDALWPLWDDTGRFEMHSGRCEILSDCCEFVIYSLYWVFMNKNLLKLGTCRYAAGLLATLRYFGCNKVLLPLGVRLPGFFLPWWGIFFSTSCIKNASLQLKLRFLECSGFCRRLIEKHINSCICKLHCIYS